MSKEQLLPYYGGCNRCGKISPLTDRGVCPRCEWPIAGITHHEASGKGLLPVLQSQYYTPVTGWEYHGGICLYGYVHPSRSREGWVVLHEEAKKDFVTNLILGTPEEILTPQTEEEQVAG
jgi:ribosomal protein L37E